MLSPFKAMRRDNDPLFAREMRQRWRRPFTWLQCLIFAGVLARFGTNIYLEVLPPGGFIAPIPMRSMGHHFVFMVAELYGGAWITFGLLLGAPALVVERDRDRLAEWMLAGMTPKSIVITKYRVLSRLVLLMTSVPFPVFALCFLMGGVSPLDLVTILVMTMAAALNSVAIGLAISAQSKTIARALVSALLYNILATPFIWACMALFLATPWQLQIILGPLMIWFAMFTIDVAVVVFQNEIYNLIKCDLSLGYSPSVAEALSAPDGPSAPDMPTEGGVLASRLAFPVQKAGVEKARVLSGAFSPTETLILRLAQNNPIAQRDVRRHLLARRENTLFRKKNWATMELKVWVLWWIAVGVCGLALCLLTRGGAFGHDLLRDAARLVLVPAMVGVALNAAPAFTQERAQKTLSELQLTALSPLEIVVGKAASVLLACAHTFAGALLALCILALAVGPLSALMLGVFGVACVVFTTFGSLTLSLWGRKTESVAVGALFSIAAVWWIGPALCVRSHFGLFFRAPIWLENLWLTPLRVALHSARDLLLALAQLAALCLAGALVAVGLCVLRLRRVGAEEVRINNNW